MPTTNEDSKPTEEEVCNHFKSIFLESVEEVFSKCINGEGSGGRSVNEAPGSSPSNNSGTPGSSPSNNSGTPGSSPSNNSGTPGSNESFKDAYSSVRIIDRDKIVIEDSLYHFSEIEKQYNFELSESSTVMLRRGSCTFKEKISDLSKSYSLNSYINSKSKTKNGNFVEFDDSISIKVQNITENVTLEYKVKSFFDRNKSYVEFTETKTGSAIRVYIVKDEINTGFTASK